MSGKGTEKTGRGGSSHPPPSNYYYYGTFQGVANYQPQPPLQTHSVIGIPQPVPPAGLYGTSPHYQSTHGYAVVSGQPFTEYRLPCCGLGVGWSLFIIGFFMGAIPWYIGAFLLVCVRLDYREKPGLVACTIAALLATLAVTLGVTKGRHSW